VIEADKAAPAADILKKNDGIELLISDVVLPGGVNGVEVATEAVAFRPDIKVILVSGYPDATLAKSGLEDTNFFLLPKPFSKTSLSEAISKVMGEKV
jgi:two-component system CheB/CheR fusion protein